MKIEIEGWHIEYNPKPFPNSSHDFDWWHDDYDGAEDSDTNHLCGTAKNKEDAMKQINEIEEL